MVKITVASNTEWLIETFNAEGDAHCTVMTNVLGISKEAGKSWFGKVLVAASLNCPNVEVYDIIAGIFSSDIYLDIYVTSDLVENN